MAGPEVNYFTFLAIQLPDKSRKTGFMLQTVKFRYSREKLHNRAQYRNI